MSPSAEPLLAGVRVLDFGIWRPVPYATQLLVEMGADVIKVEPPDGDPMRVFPDLFAILNANKRAVALDLKNEAERAVALELAAQADVVVEGYRPGVAERLGIGYDAIRRSNPAVVYCSVSGYGQTGPMRDVPGHDLNYQALAGIIEPRAPGAEPPVARPPLADLAGGVYAAMAICAALVRAQRTGEGERIDVAMADVLATWTGPLPALQVEDGYTLSGGVPGYGSFRTSDDQWIALGVIAEEHLWTALVTALELTELVSLRFLERVQRTDELNGLIATQIGKLDRTTAVDKLSNAGVPVSPVLGQRELADNPHLLARGVVRRDIAGQPAMGHPVTYTQHPAVDPGEVPSLARGPAARPQWQHRA